MSLFFDHQSMLDTGADVLASLGDDVQLDQNIKPPSSLDVSSGQPAVVLLTGATGFIGAHLLDELLRRTFARVYCLVRAGNDREAVGRLGEALNRFHLSPPPENRVIPIAGDLSLPRLGLGHGFFNRLASEVDAIYGIMPQTNAGQSYSTLRPVILNGTKELLRLACKGRIQLYHHISCMSVFGLPLFSDRDTWTEDDVLDGLPDKGNGFALGKWAAERLVRQAQDRGLPCNIYRLGSVSGHSRSGAANTRDLEAALIRASLKLGRFPNPENRFNPAPVDYICAAVFQLSQHFRARGKTYHMLPPKPAPTDALPTAAGEEGFPLSIVSPEEWSDTPGAALGREPIYPDWQSFGRIRLASSTVKPPRAFSRNTREALSGKPAFPQMDAAYYSRMLRYYRQCGFVEDVDTPCAS
ncbi:MAG: thioester reductase domain-containing protein [Acidobacteriota bacterium]|nr:thioester reductase domain-containing protein [Acidobacteriota bacterium]